MKKLSSISQLAVFGAEPAFSQQLHVGRPNIGNREAFMRRVDTLLDRQWLTNNGPMVQEFEKNVARYLDVAHCVAMCNGTIALEIAIRALELTGEVIVPSFTFVATAHALQWQEITPVFADIDPLTYNLDPASVERMITPRTSAVVGVHVWGRPCAVEALESIARRHDLVLMYDAAHAFGCSHRGKMIGNFGACEILSFHATKFFNTFEGGAVVTNDHALAEKLRLMRNFGFHGTDNVIYVGTNGKMPEICAAMGLTGLESIAQTISVNRDNYRRYADAIAGIPGLRLVPYSDTEKTNYQYVVLEVGDEFPVTRDELMRIMHAENVLARRYFYPGCHEMEPYRSFFPHAGLLLPNTGAACGRVLSFPTGTAVGEAEVSALGALFKFISERGAEIAAGLRGRPA